MIWELAGGDWAEVQSMWCHMVENKFEEVVWSQPMDGYKFQLQDFGLRSKRE